MNERLIELMNQANKDAGFTFSMDQAKPVHDLMEKFAELMIAEFSDIVKETAILVAQTAYGDGEDSVSVQKRVAGALQVLEVLRKRFGVKE